MNLRSPRPGRTTARRRDQARALFRDGILEAAERVFAERGVQATRIQDIAQRARVAVGTVYNHFDSKDDVLGALIDERAQEMVACLGRQPDDPPAFRPAFERRVERVLRYADGHRGFCALLLAHGLGNGQPDPGRVLNPKARRRVEKLRAAWLALVDEGQADGALAMLERNQLASFFGGAVRSVILSDDFEASPSLPELAALVARLVLDGAATRRAS